MSLNPFTTIATAVGGLISEFVTDKDERNRLSATIAQKALEISASELAARRSIIVSEAQGESSAQRNWRPHLMYLIMGLLVFNGVAVPLVEAFSDVDLPILDAWGAIPHEMWSLLQIGMGGYIASRGIEKTVKNWRKS